MWRAFTVLKTKSDPSGRSQHYLRGRNRLDGPWRRDPSAILRIPMMVMGDSDGIVMGVSDAS